MKYIIIEDISTDFPDIVKYEGKPRIFNTELEAVENLMGYGTDAIVVPLSKNLMNWEVDDSMPDDWDDETKWPPKSDTTVYL